MGAKIEVQDNVAIVTGVSKLTGADVLSSNLRAGAALIMLGLRAEGKTTVRGLEHVWRGYEGLVEKFPFARRGDRNSGAGGGLNAGGAFIPGVKTSASSAPRGPARASARSSWPRSSTRLYICDDGLVIHKGSIVCGKSAKSERNQISAIPRAALRVDDHRREVVLLLPFRRAMLVMVIATSDNMALKILKKLDLPAPEQIVHIEDVRRRKK